MKTEACRDVVLFDFEPEPANFEAEFLVGLRTRPKILPCRFFYDRRGSHLFDRICDLEEYYVTRTETRILRDHFGEIADFCGPRCVLVEPGSGSSRKTRMLLEHLDDPVAYVPIDISRAHLVHAAESLNGDLFPLEILPVCADYNRSLTLPLPSRSPDSTVVFFPGSTIGNFTPDEAVAFLRRVADWCEPGDSLLIGVDLQKDRGVMHRAYNDSQRVTAEFNLNLLVRANAELRANFVPAQFQHNAVYDEEYGRMEMQLISRCRQRVAVAGEVFDFRPGEVVTTEYSYKYLPEGFHVLASAAGWRPERTWTDRNGWFSVHGLRLDRHWA